MKPNEQQLEKLKDAKLDWDKAFIDSPCSKRCLCIPFNDELNALYDEKIRLGEQFSSLFSLMAGLVTL